MRLRYRRHGGYPMYAHPESVNPGYKRKPPLHRDVFGHEHTVPLSLFSIEGVEPVVIAYPYVGFQFAEVVNRQIWIHAQAFTSARRSLTGNTIIRYRTATGHASFPSLCDPSVAQHAVNQVRQRMEQPLAESLEAHAWLTYCLRS